MRKIGDVSLVIKIFPFLNHEELCCFCFACFLTIHAEQLSVLLHEVFIEEERWCIVGSFKSTEFATGTQPDLPVHKTIGVDSGLAGRRWTAWMSPFSKSDISALSAKSLRMFLRFSFARLGSPCVSKFARRPCCSELLICCCIAKIVSAWPPTVSLNSPSCFSSSIP